MEPTEDFTMPEDLTSIDQAALIELAEAIDARSNELAAAETITADDADEIETLAEQYAAINDELVSREEAQTELRERAQAARERIAGSEAAAETEPEEGEPEEGEPEEGEPETEPVEAEPETEPVLVEATASAALVPTRPIRRAAALATALTERQASHAPETIPEAPSEGNPLDGVQLSATRLAGSEYEAGTPMSVQELASAITSKRLRMGNIPAGIHDERVTLASAEMPWDQAGRLLSVQPQENFLMMREARDQAMTLVASGGPCTPFPPRYEIFRLAQPHDPVAQGVPSLGAPRAGVKWIAPPDFREARAGVGTVTCAEDEAGFGSGSGEATYKPCVSFDCPGEREVCVTAVSHCIKFGNLQFMVFPEWVESRVADLFVEFTSVKEVLYLDVIDSESIATTTAAADGYGLARRVFSDAMRAAAGYRKRNGMNVDSMLDWFVPSWLADAVVVDLINDHSDGVAVLLGGFNASAYFTTLAREARLNVTVYYDSATGEDQAFTTVQLASALNDWPEDAVTYMFAPGTFVRFDGGSLDVGLIRDSVLNRTNDLEIFAEEWVNMAKLGIESIKITHQDVCPNGAAPEPDSLISC